MFNKKLKQRIQSLEAQVRGLSEENQNLVVERNQFRLEKDAQVIANDMLKQQIKRLERRLYRPRNKKGQFLRKGEN